MSNFNGRTTRNFKQNHTNDKCFPNAAGYCNCPLELTPEKSAALVCSDIPNVGWMYQNMHMPVIDLDLPCKLIESGTPGHYHLYIDKAVAFDQYVSILKAMSIAGIVQWGFTDATIARGYGSVRHPDRPKLTKE